MPVPSQGRVMHPLIGSDRIEGTLVCRPDGTQLGTIERLMVNKISGQVAYAVVKCAERSGLLHKFRFPVRWDSLHYDRRRGAYLVDLTDEEIRRTPAGNGGFDWGDRNEAAHIRPFRPPTFWGSSY
jgi:PRC-barrel domain